MKGLSLVAVYYCVNPISNLIVKAKVKNYLLNKQYQVFLDNQPKRLKNKNKFSQINKVKDKYVTFNDL